MSSHCIISVDPAASNHLGLCCLDENGKAEAIASIPMTSGKTIECVDLKVVPWILKHSAWRPIRLGLEKCPPTARKDVNHGPQAAIGFPQGLVCGLIIGALHESVLVRPTLIEVGDWRSTMVQAGGRRPGGRRQRPSLQTTREKPERHPSGTGFLVGYRGCDHQLHARDFEALANTAMTCTRCAARPADISEDWKRCAWEFAVNREPQLMDDVLRKAMKSARKEKKHPANYAGVADAAEAYCIAFHHYLQTREASNASL